MSTSSAASNRPESQSGDRPKTHPDSQDLIGLQDPHADIIYDSFLEELPLSSPSISSQGTPLSTQTKAHPHVHDPNAQRKLINRLARIEGHVRGIRTMIDRHEPCPDVLLQIAAVRGALDRVARLILDDHITECIAHAAESGDIKVELDELKKALDRFIR